MVKNILLLDAEGKRVAVKYCSDDWPTNSAKEAFEKAIFNKTQKTNARTEGNSYFQFLLIIQHIQSILVSYQFETHGTPSDLFMLPLRCIVSIG